MKYYKEIWPGKLNPDINEIVFLFTVKSEIDKQYSMISVNKIC